MNEYNERLLKNVLEDYREEQTEQLKKEIEDVKNNPLFQNKEGEAEAFALKYTKKKSNKPVKLFVRVASILLVLAICLTFIPFTVEGRKSTVAEIIANFVNSEFIAFDSNEDDNLLLSYEGKFVPTWIPDGYRISKVNNGMNVKEIVFSDSDNTIIFRELSLDVKSNIDYADAENLQKIEIFGYKGMSFRKDDMNRIVVTIDDTVLYISCDDDSVDLTGFAELIEKR